MIAAFRHGRWILTLAVVVAAVEIPTGQAQTAQPPSPGQAAQPQTPFRAGVDLVSLNVTVSDGGGKYITDLAASDFNVFEDGVKQDVTFFTRTNLPIALAVLMDTSASMDSKLPTAQEAAIGFAKRLRPQDVAEVIDFDNRVMVLQNFTNNAAELEQAIRKTSAGGSTSLYNAVYIALKDLKKVVAKNADEIRRQAIVVLSDGEDTSSLLPFEEVLDLAKRSETAIYSIGLRVPEGPGSSTKGFKEAEFVMRQFSQETGGRSFFPNQLSEPKSSRASTPSATRRRTRNATGHGAASSYARRARAPSHARSSDTSRRPCTRNELHPVSAVCRCARRVRAALRTP